jgi:hypothetical protein
MNVARRVGEPTLYERGCRRPIFPHHWLNQSACCQSAPIIDPPVGVQNCPPCGGLRRYSKGDPRVGKRTDRNPPDPAICRRTMNDRFEKRCCSSERQPWARSCHWSVRHDGLLWVVSRLPCWSPTPDSLSPVGVVVTGTAARRRTNDGQNIGPSFGSTPSLLPKAETGVEPSESFNDRLLGKPPPFAEYNSHEQNQR